MASCPVSEQATFLLPPLSTPSLSSEDGQVIDIDHRPILERENDDDGPPPIRSPQRRARSALPPAPPTSRGNSFDEPLWIQNARSSADLWLRGWWIEERFDTKYAPVAVNAIHHAPYRDAMLNSELLWEDEFNSRATSIQSSHSSYQSDLDNGNVAGMLSSRESSTYSSLTFQSTEDNQLTIQHRNFGTEDLRRLDEHGSSAKEGYRFCEIGNSIRTRFSNTTSPTVTLGTTAGHACYVGCRAPAERTINCYYHGSNDVSPPKDHLLQDQPQTAACENDLSGRGACPRFTAELEPMVPDRSVFEDYERQGSMGRLAVLFRSPRGPRRALRKGRLRSRISKLFKRLSCYSTSDET